MANKINIWIILHPYSTSRRLSKLVVLGVFSLLALYIVVFCRTAAGIQTFKEKVQWYQSRLAQLALGVRENFPDIPNPIIDQPDWQTVELDNDGNIIGVYSAFFFETRDNTVIITGSRRSLSSLPQSQVTNKKLQCRFHTGVNHTISTDAKLYNIFSSRDDDGLLIKCPVPGAGAFRNVIPPAVSIVSTENGETPIKIIKNRLRILQRIPGSAVTEFKLSLCLLPINRQYNNVLNFLEWLEYHKMMGVQKFTFYNMSIGPNVSCIMNHLHYESLKGYGPPISVLPWNNYSTTPKQSRFKHRNTSSSRRGILAAQVDCLFRHVGISKYVLVTDVNEFLVPQLAGNASELLEFLDYLHSFESSHQFGKYVFSKELIITPNSKSQDARRITKDNCDKILKSKSGNENSALSYRICENLLMNIANRDKYKKTVANHSVPSYIMTSDRMKLSGYPNNILESGFKPYQLPETIAYIRHYKKGKMKDDEVNDKYDNQEEEAMEKMNPRLISTIAKSVEYFMGKCGLEPEDVFKS